jgi:glycosyltransferase involved in cell wall biosynthesis
VKSQLLINTYLSLNRRLADLSKKVSVLIPAYNEEKYIKDTVEAIIKLKEVNEVVVVDDASQDNTSDLARAAGATVFTLPSNQGKGGALNYGLQNITGDIIALVDGDLGKSAGDVQNLIIPVLAEQADMTIAMFPRAKKKGGFGLVKGLAHHGIKHYTGLYTNAPLSGQRVMTRQVVEAIGHFASGYGVEVGLTIDVAKKGFRILEVQTNMTHAETGRDLKGFVHRGKQFIAVLKELCKRTF